MGQYEHKFIRKGNEYPYSDSSDEDGYFYKVSICYEDRDGEVVITADGVSLVYDDAPDTVVMTNIEPEQLFGTLDRLEEKHLIRIMDILSVSGCDGQSQDLKAIYEKWVDEGKP